MTNTEEQVDSKPETNAHIYIVMGLACFFFVGLSIVGSLLG